MTAHSELAFPTQSGSVAGVANYRAFQVTGHRQFRLVDRPLDDPAPGQVRLRVLACGVCHSDVLAVDGQRPDPDRPIVPGHEVAGVVDAIGAGVTGWEVGDRAGVGFLGGPCLQCQYCRWGDFVNCTDQPISGTTVDGGYAEMTYVRASGLVRIPESLSPTAAAPLLCAGITTANALRAGAPRPGALVAIQGLGGLGHLGVQYAKKLGYHVAVIARGPDKAELAATLGGDHYIDSAAADPADALTALGGAEVIVATAASGASMSPLLRGLRPNGRLVVVGAAPDPISVATSDLIFGGRSILGSLTGTAAENEGNLVLSAERGVAAMIEPMPFDRAPEAYEHMMSGRARFRVVLDIASA
jgi:alcohol dehydrogenase, propanol-preferring